MEDLRNVHHEPEYDTEGSVATTGGETAVLLEDMTDSAEVVNEPTVEASGERAGIDFGTNETTTADDATVEPITEQPAPVKKRGGLIAIGVIGGVVIAAIAALAVLFFTGVISIGKSAAATDNTSITAWLNEDGTAYIAYLGGETIKIAEECKGAWLTADRKTVVVQNAGGALYYTDVKQTEKHSIADNVVSVNRIRDVGIIYTTEDDDVYRYAFGADEPELIGNNVKFECAENTLSVLYADDDENICVLRANESESVKLGSYANRVHVDGISDDGMMAVWTEVSEDESAKINLSCNELRETLGTVENSVFMCYWSSVVFGNGVTIVTHVASEELYIKRDGEDALTVKLGEALESSYIFNENGQVNNENLISAKDAGFYAFVEADSDSNMYWIDMAGERERVLSNVDAWDVKIANGMIAYLDEDETLKTGRISEATISDEAKVASDVGTYEISENGKYLYYIRDYDSENETGTLYAYNIEKQESQKIASEVGTSITLAKDGKTVYYYRDIEADKADYTDIGTLYAFSISKGEPIKISSDVIINSITTNTRSDVVDEFVYMKYDGITTVDTYSSDLLEPVDHDSLDEANVTMSLCDEWFATNNTDTIDYCGDTYYLSHDEAVYEGKYLYWELDEKTFVVNIYELNIEESDEVVRILYRYDGKESTKLSGPVISH